MQWNFKYLISSFIVIVCCLQQYCLAQTTTVRPYKFGFTIDEQQHRYEKRDERGIVMGEFGFITADGIYHVTVYATDEQGRFRILAMKNYPYESPPKSVEVLVKPKTPITTTTTTTTEKPVLIRHNFNTEACSGCFLKNGNNKPKPINGIDNTNVKTEIRPLSKILPSSPQLPGSAQTPTQGAQPKFPSKTATTGNNIKSTDALVTFTFKSKKPDVNINTKNILIATQNDDTIKNTPATLFLTKDSNVAKHLTQSATKVNTFNNGQKQLFTDTTQSVIQNIQIPLKTKTNKILHNSHLQNDLQHENTLNTAESIQIPTSILGILENMLDNNVNKDLFADSTKSVIQNIQMPLKTKTNNILHNTQLKNDNRYENSLDTAQSVPKTIFGTSGNTPITQEILLTTPNSYKTYTANPATTATNSGSIVETYTNTPTYNAPTTAIYTPIYNKDANPLPTTTNRYSGILEIRHTQTPTVSKDNNRIPSSTIGIRYTKTPTYANNDNPISTTPSGSSGIQHTQTPIYSKISNPIPTIHNEEYSGNNGIRLTQTPTYKKENTPITTKRPQVSPGLTSTANTQTGNPPIMDIIVKKILPALMGNKGISPTTTNQNKPKVSPSSNIPGTSKTFTPAGNPGSNTVFNSKTMGSSNPSSSVNGDGDLYRFKYILDYNGHTETGKRNGNKEGNYYSIGDDNVERTIEYVANENGYQPRIRWRKLDTNEIKAKENTLKDYEFIWFTQ